jgi:hypothetical protein
LPSAAVWQVSQVCSTSCGERCFMVKVVALATSARVASALSG